MKNIVFAVNHNRADIIPFWLRHYEQFADELSVFDDASTDGSQELLMANPKVILREWPYPGSGIDDELFLAHAYEWYPKAHPAFDWVLWVDMDEFLYHPQMPYMLRLAEKDGYEVIQPEGFNMIARGLPKDRGQNLCHVCHRGVPASVYSKPVIFKPGIHIRWNRGKHALESGQCNPKVWTASGIKLLHYRFLGRAYTAARNAQNYARCGLKTGDKGPAWTCAPDYHGEHSADWAEKMLKEAKDVL